MTKTTAIKRINAMGLSARATHCGAEIRVTYRLTDSRLNPPVGPGWSAECVMTRSYAIERAEAVAYYTECPIDAVLTAQHMTSIPVKS